MYTFNNTTGLVLTIGFKTRVFVYLANLCWFGKTIVNYLEKWQTLTNLAVYKLLELYEMFWEAVALNIFLTFSRFMF